jgi:hypothetical protein
MEKAEPDQVLSMGVVRDFGQGRREFGRVPVQIPALR